MRFKVFFFLNNISLKFRNKGIKKKGKIMKAIRVETYIFLLWPEMGKRYCDMKDMWWAAPPIVTNICKREKGVGVGNQ